jgi:RimJ/RimL family protein N-acetyltransferase
VAGAVEKDESLYLWVADDNPRAHRFYTRNGFSLDGGVEQLLTDAGGVVRVEQIDEVELAERRSILVAGGT